MYPNKTVTYTKLEQMAHGHLHSLGIRFHTHDQFLPGRPDIVLESERLVVEVRGCFFHQHGGNCPDMRIPGGKVDWAAKFKRTMERDAANVCRLRRMSYRQLVIWGCGLRYCTAGAVRSAIADFIRGPDTYREIGRDEIRAFAPATAVPEAAK